VHVANTLGLSPIDPAGYGRTPAFGMLEATLDGEPFLEPVTDLSDRQPGDLLLMRFTAEPQHLAIFTGDTINHAYEAPGLCCEHLFYRPLAETHRLRLSFRRSHAMSSTGQIVGGGVGAIAGFFLLSGNVFLGAQIGMAIGGALDPPKGPTTTGPRLDDLTVQTSSYGQTIPRVYGTVKVTGNVLWLENNHIKEKLTKKKSGGKGGKSKTTHQGLYLQRHLRRRAVQGANRRYPS
jgi:cell wall-associated NlpC family hydrolase